MKLLIIDDDVQIREGIQLGIDWDAIGIEQVTTCANGADGLEISRSFLPDIVLSDIRMPQMDGLEFLSKIHEICPAKVIMISGYSDFEYCRKAIRYGAEDYILKPVKVRELIQLVSRIRDNILAEHSTKEKFQEYKTAYEKETLQKILEGEIQDPNVVRGYFLEKFGNQDVKRMLCAVIAVERCGENQKDYGTELAEQIKDCCSSVWAMVETGRDEYLLLVETAPSQMYVIHQQSSIRRWLEEFGKSHIQEKITLSAGISRETILSEIRAGYCQAKELLARRIYAGRGSVHVAGEWSEIIQCPQKAALWEQCEVSAARVAEHREKKGLEDELRLIRKYIEQNKVTDLKEIRGIYLKCCTGINEQFQQRGEETLFDLVKMNEELQYLSYTKDYEEKLIQICEDLLENRQQVCYGKYQAIIVRALTYMEKHYAENLTTGSMGKVLEITPNYRLILW